MKKSMFQFSNPRIVSFSITANDDFDESKYNGFQISSEVDHIILKEDTEAVVVLSLEIGKETEEYPFYITLKISASFKNNDAGNFEKLISINAPALLLSYARPVVSLMTTQLGYKAFHIPFMNFTEDDITKKDTN